MKLTLLLFTALVLSAEIADQPPKPDYEHWADYFQAESALKTAQDQYNAANKTLQEKAAVLKADCGEKFQPGIDQRTGKGSCLPKPESPKDEKNKEKE